MRAIVLESVASLGMLAERTNINVVQVICDLLDIKRSRQNGQQIPG